MSIISVDFDGTLRGYDGVTLSDTINIIRMHELVGDEIHIVTRRKYNDLHAGIWGPEVIDWVKDNVGDYPVHFTEGEWKWGYIAQLNPAYHYDDDQDELNLIAKYTDTMPVLVEPKKLMI